MKSEKYINLIVIGIIGKSNYIWTILNGSIQEVKSKGGKPISFLQYFYINKGDRTFHWVVHSDLKELDINDFFERKEIIEDMKAELTEAQKKLKILKIRRWLKRQMLLKPSLHNPRLSTIWQLVWKKNERNMIFW